MSLEVETEWVTESMPSATAREDRLGRFAPTPLSAALCVMDRSLTLETNSAAVLRQVRRALEPYGAGSREQSEYLWRIVSENRRSGPDTAPEAAAFGTGNLRVVHFGRDCFFAADFDKREAIGYIPEFLAASESAFFGAFLAAAFRYTAPALGLTRLSAACLALDGKGMLLFGPAGITKSAVSRLAAKVGMEFHSDHATFLEIKANGMRAWGQCWPDFPEPEASALEHGASADSLLAYSERSARSFSARRVTPVLCIFLEPSTTEVPRLSPIHSRASLRRLQEEGLAGATDPQPGDPDRIGALSRLPAYRLGYGHDPAAAALFLHSMLRTHNLLEAQS